MAYISSNVTGHNIIFCSGRNLYLGIHLMYNQCSKIQIICFIHFCSFWFKVRNHTFAYALIATRYKQCFDNHTYFSMLIILETLAILLNNLPIRFGSIIVIESLRGYTYRILEDLYHNMTRCF